VARAATTKNRTKTARPRRTSKASAEKSPSEFCVFCEIVAGRIPSHKVWESRDFIAFLDIKPIRPGHILLVPRKHHESLFDLPAALYERAFRTARTLAAPLGKHLGTRVGIVVEGFGVAHAHIHLVPISEAGQLNPALASEASAEDLQRMREALARVLKTRN
jgi:histidine triad (HIT) family protein